MPAAMDASQKGLVAQQYLPHVMVRQLFARLLCLRQWAYDLPHGHQLQLWPLEKEMGGECKRYRERAAEG